jgi:hypothetical protein
LFFSAAAAVGIFVPNIVQTPAAARFGGFHGVGYARMSYGLSCK